MYSKTCVKWPLSQRPKIGSQDRLSLNVGQTYCRMLQWEHSAILSTFIKLAFVMKIFVLSIFEWPLKTGFTVYYHKLGYSGLGYPLISQIVPMYIAICVITLLA